MKNHSIKEKKSKEEGDINNKQEKRREVRKEGRSQVLGLFPLSQMEVH